MRGCWRRIEWGLGDRFYSMPDGRQPQVEHDIRAWGCLTLSSTWSASFHRAGGCSFWVILGTPVKPLLLVLEVVPHEHIFGVPLRVMGLALLDTD